MPVIDETTYSAPYFLSNSHISTIIPNLFRFPFGIKYERERIDTHDGDFIDLDWSKVGSRRLIIFSHGLESSSRAPYVMGMVKFFNRKGWDGLAWNFRSCSGEMNRTPHFYHPGQTEDYDLVVQRALKENYDVIGLVGFSLGGAYILRYLGEKGQNIAPRIRRSVVFSVPTDLGASAKHLCEGSQSMYARAFLYKYKKKMIEKARVMPDDINLEPWEVIKTLRDFDSHYNAKWYGFENVDEFYHSISSKHVLKDITVPTLIVNAKNDPFLPEECYPVEEAKANRHVFLEMPDMGGHVGFLSLSWNGIYWSETRAEAFLNEGVGEL